MTFWRHVRAVAFLPAMVLIAVPAAVVSLTASGHPGWGGRASVGPAFLGGGLVAFGLGMMGWTIGLFATVGDGTLAPWDPTERLVVRGPYRHVRNPMITGVFSVLLGEVVLLASLPLLIWAAVFGLANAAYIPLVEERGLERRFATDYATYKQHVPRWVPRLTPWSPQLSEAGR